MSIAKIMDKIFLNDRLVDTDNAAISASDGGFLYGAGLFETMRCCNGVVFALEDHLNRLFASAEALSINNTCEKKIIAEAIYEVLRANELTDARLRLTLTGGPVSISDDKPKSTLLITATKFQPYPQEYYQKGALAVLCSYRQNPGDPTCGHKTTSYFPRIIGLEAARAKKAAEALWFTVDNRLAEGCISNVFLVKDSTLYTPPLSTPVLPGVMRKTVCKIAAENSIKLVEDNIRIDDLLGADEIFLTNVIMQVLPIIKVEKHDVGRGKVGPMTKKLIAYVDEFIKTFCGQGK